MSLQPSNSHSFLITQLIQLSEILLLYLKFIPFSLFVVKVNKLHFFFCTGCNYSSYFKIRDSFQLVNMHHVVLHPKISDGNPFCVCDANMPMTFCRLLGQILTDPAANDARIFTHPR